MKCPNCDMELELISESGEHNGPNGGNIFVAEDMETCIEEYDNNITTYKCPFCRTGVYVSEPK